MTAQHRIALFSILVALLATAIWPGVSAVSAQEGTLESLKRDFVNLPPDTRPGCYWYWINDNVSKEGITKDLEAMARVGIGRAYIGHIFDRRKETDTPPGKVKLMSDEWWGALQWAVKEADRCGIEIGFFNSPGWSQSGAPWIKPSQSMRYLGHSETVVMGGRPVDVVLPVPPITTYPNAGGSRPIRTGPDFTAADFKDVRVIAYRQPAIEAVSVPVHLSAFTGTVAEGMHLFDGSDSTSFAFPANKEETITLRVRKADARHPAVQTAILKPLDGSYTLVCTVEESDDGTSFRTLTTYQEERGHQGPKRGEEVVVPLGKVRGEYLRLKLTFRARPPSTQIRVAEIAVSTEARLAGYVRKQLGETSPKTKIPADAYVWGPQPVPVDGSVVRSQEVIDLTERMGSDGRLRWDAPPGKWTVLRMGMIPIGTQSHPASAEGRGLEIDKMNRDHAAAIFDGMVGEFLRRTPAQDRKALKYVIADSYETGPQNWTDGFEEKFTKRFSYPPARFLPVIAGRVVDSPEVSDRFLWDFRQLIVESVAFEYVGGLRDVANRHGLTLWLENYGHWGFISEFLLYGSQTDEVGGEFWESSDPINNVECRAAASSAHIYGKRSVYAEAFTSNRNFKQSPATLKRWCDWAFGAGINHIILHVYIHQPDERRPGIIEWFGTAFNRHNTWFEQSKAFVEYMRRAAVLLKAGRPAADVAYYIGENSPSMQGPMDPDLPPGYDFDNINADVLVNRARVVNGRITLPDGTSYAVLVLPKQKQMRPEVAAAIQGLVHEGAVVVGPKPERSPSLKDYPACDARVQAIADELWDKVDGTKVTARRYGNGWIYDGLTLNEVFSERGIHPDVTLLNSQGLLCTVAGGGKLGVNKTGGVLFKHRQGDGFDVYFLSNTSGSPADATVSFRQSGRKPYLWNAVTGKVKTARAFTQKAERTLIPLRLEPSESVFLVFGERIAADRNGVDDSNAPAYETLARLDDGWKVRFDGEGAPKELVFDKLTDWSKSPDMDIRHYSGTATYERTFTLPKGSRKPVVLDLGTVGVIATVIVNDKTAGTVWTNPCEIDVTDLVREGDNTLKVRVTNTWNNRLVADAEKKFGEPRTYVSQPYGYNKEQPLLSSGLIGPVVLQASKRVND